MKPLFSIHAGSGTSDLSFTGMNQDTSPGLYDFPAREYETSGRWPSPDPAGMAAVDPTNPQSWNRYAYVGNNPLAYIDPSGMNECAPNNGNPMNNPSCFKGVYGTMMPGSYGVDVYNYDSGFPVAIYPGGVYQIGVIELGIGGLSSGDAPIFGTPTAGSINPIGPSTIFSSSSGSSGGGASSYGGFLTGLKRAVSIACSIVPDASTLGGGFDLGYGATAGASVNLLANGNSGELSVQITGTLSYGSIANDAYGSLGVVYSAPSNASTTGFSKTSAYGVGRVGVVNGSNSLQGTLGPSILPITFARQGNATGNQVTVPYAGYLLQPTRALCKLVTGD
jgi:RHS repeat-associated protein